MTYLEKLKSDRRKHLLLAWILIFVGLVFLMAVFGGLIDLSAGNFTTQNIIYIPISGAIVTLSFWGFVRLKNFGKNITTEDEAKIFYVKKLESVKNIIVGVFLSIIGVTGAVYYAVSGNLSRAFQGIIVFPLGLYIAIRFYKFRRGKIPPEKMNKLF